MLVLTRKTGESIKIGDNIEITVLSVKNDQVKIGINAPKDLEILRKELLDLIQEENVQASSLQENLLALLSKNNSK